MFGFDSAVGAILGKIATIINGWADGEITPISILTILSNQSLEKSIPVLAISGAVLALP